MPDLKLFLLGTPQLVCQRETIDLSLRKGMALVAYLAVEKREHSRDYLATLLWPERNQRALTIHSKAHHQDLILRTSLHTGECEFKSGEISGITRQIAESILMISEPGQNLVSKTVKDLVVGAGFQFEEGDPCIVKGVSGVWRTFSVA